MHSISIEYWHMNVRLCHLGSGDFSKRTICCCVCTLCVYDARLFHTKNRWFTTALLNFFVVSVYALNACHAFCQLFAYREYYGKLFLEKLLNGDYMHQEFMVCRCKRTLCILCAASLLICWKLFFFLFFLSFDEFTRNRRLSISFCKVIATKWLFLLTWRLVKKDMNI